jgi:hypothetical protein
VARESGKPANLVLERIVRDPKRRKAEADDLMLATPWPYPPATLANPPKMQASGQGKNEVIVRIIVFAAFMAAGGIGAAAQNISGHYRVEGTNSLYGEYSGTADIEIIAMSAGDICRVEYSDGDAGICMLKDTTLAVAYPVRGRIGIIVYEISRDGSMQGLFVEDGGISGKEKMIPVR